MMFLTLNGQIVGPYNDSLSASNFREDLAEACEAYEIEAESPEDEGYYLTAPGSLETDSIMAFFDECTSWADMGVDELMDEMCDRKNINRADYEDYESLYARLSE